MADQAKGSVDIGNGLNTAPLANHDSEDIGGSGGSSGGGTISGEGEPSGGTLGGAGGTVGGVPGDLPGGNQPPRPRRVGRRRCRDRG